MVDVYAQNLGTAITMMKKWTQDYKFIAVDTEFPGIVADADDEYEKMTDSVNATSMIQLGVTFYNGQGEKPPYAHTFQFNFKWDEKKENKNAKSIEMLKRSGVRFDKLAKDGIDEQDFVDAFEELGLLRNSEIVWLLFHGSYDLGYLVKMFSKDDLRARFLFDLMLKHLFPFVLDLKVLASEVGKFGGLDRLCNDLKVKRNGQAHTAGSDAEVTGDAFYALLNSSVESRENYFSQINKIFALSYEK